MELTKNTKITFNEMPDVLSELRFEFNELKQILLSKFQDPVEQSDKLLTIQEAAGLLHLSVPTVYGLVHRKEVPVCKKGKRLYFPKQELIEWIKTGRKQTASELSEEASTDFRNANNKKSKA